MAPLGVNRRELLAFLLGAPLAAAACRHGRAPRLPEGGFAGGAERLGHLLRDRPPPQVPAVGWQRAAVVIVGAGAAGLAAAWRLQRAGVRDFVLLELDDAAGGTARAGASPVTAYPWGAHYIVAPHAGQRALVALLDDMGCLDGRDPAGQPVIAEQFRCREPEERLWAHGRWHEGLYLHDGESADDRRQLAAFLAEVARLAGLRDGRGRPAFTIPVSACSDDPELTGLDRLSMAQWLDGRGLDSPRLRWLIDYACRDDYGLTCAHTSAWAGLFYFAARWRDGGDSAPVVTWPEGNGRIVGHLARLAGQRLRVGCAAADVAPVVRDGRPAADVIAWTDGGAGVLGLRADQVIVAAPQFVAARIVRPWRERRPDHIGAFRYAPWLVANLHLGARPAERRGFPAAWDNVLRTGAGLGYVSATHQRGRDHGPTVWTYYLPLDDADDRAARRRLHEGDWAAWADAVLADLEPAHPDLRERVDRVDVMRWGHGMVQPRPGMMWGPERAAAARPLGAIHFAHSDLSGLALFEEALDQGLRAAEEVLAARGVPTESWR